MKFRKKPVVIDAMQWAGTNIEAIKAFCPAVMTYTEFANKYHNALKLSADFRNSLFIQTLEGVHEGQRLDWVIRGVAGEFYFCKPDIFEQTYEGVQ